MTRSVEKRPFVTPLYEGTYSVGLDKKFIRIGRDDPPRKNSLKLSINPFLIKGEERNILFDAGLGEFGEKTSTNQILTNLEFHGLSSLDITDIFTSHLHYDHLGGLAGRPDGYWELTFPEAQIWVSRQDWNELLEREEAKGDSEKLEFLHFLEARADLQDLESGKQPLPEVRAETAGGHTKHSQILYFEENEEKYLMAGDILGTKGAVNRTYTAKYDFDPKQSMAVREKIKKYAFDEGAVIMAYHETESPLFRLTSHDPKKGYLMEDAAS
ncbi:MAG: MBL fold metallo-hydrolase [Balneolaceae bacterium]